MLGPRAKDFASRGPRNLRSGGTPPKIRCTLYVGRRCIRSRNEFGVGDSMLVPIFRQWGHGLFET